jgi:hypothetical protein
MKIKVAFPSNTYSVIASIWGARGIFRIKISVKGAELVCSRLKL